MKYRRMTWEIRESLSKGPKTISEICRDIDAQAQSVRNTTGRLRKRGHAISVGINGPGTYPTVWKLTDLGRLQYEWDKKTDPGDSE